ncbi:MAG: DUF4199 domain-containing protein [Bacteroidota bacterium]
MEKSLKPVWKHALSWGFLTALIVMVLSLISYMTGLGEARGMQWVQVFIVIAMVVVSQVFYRNENAGISISYGKAFGVGMLTGISAAIILAVYNYMFFAFIAPDMVDYMREQAEIAVMQQDIPGSAQQKALEVQEKFITPLMISVTGIFSLVFWVLIGTLISSAFTKGLKQQADQDIETEGDNEA